MTNHPITAIDFFAGFGGWSESAKQTGKVRVVACINHDPVAIACHKANHPEAMHYQEDIRLIDEGVLPMVDAFFVSAECTHFSNAKGGGTREEGSRTLSWDLLRFVRHCQPTTIYVENVPEFLTWGPLKEKRNKKGEVIYKNGKPCMIPDTDINKLGSEYKAWVLALKGMGYGYQARILDSADFGAYTSRRRYIGIFVKLESRLRIKFPTPTHAKKPQTGSHILKWNAVADKLNLDKIGQSIFDRKKPLVENTLSRILAGLEKYVPKNPSPAVRVVQYIDGYKTRDNAISSIHSPLPTIDTCGNKGLVTVQMLDKYYGRSNVKPLDEPCPTITCNDRFSLVSCLTGKDKFQFLEKDSPNTRKIKAFMQAHQIADIYTRMLDVEELKRIQGFPEHYILSGKQKEDKKGIGNSVEVTIGTQIIKTMLEANYVETL